MNIEKTTILSVDGKNISVAELPMPVRKQVELFDAFREEQAKDAIKLEMSTMAVNVKQLQLQEIVRTMLNPVPVERAATPAEPEAAPENG